MCQGRLELGRDLERHRLARLGLAGSTSVVNWTAFGLRDPAVLLGRLRRLGLRDEAESSPISDRNQADRGADPASVGAGEDGQLGVGQGPLAGEAAILVGADHVADLAAERLLAGRRPGGDLELDAPGHLVLVVFEEGDVGEGRLLLLDRRAEGDQSPWTFRPAGSKKSNSVYFGPLSGWVLRILVDVPGGVDLGRDLVGHGVARPGLGRGDGRGEGRFLGPGGGPAVLLGRLGVGAWATVAAGTAIAARSTPRRANANLRQIGKLRITSRPFGEVGLARTGLAAPSSRLAYPKPSPSRTSATWATDPTLSLKIERLHPPDDRPPAVDRHPTVRLLDRPEASGRAGSRSWSRTSALGAAGVPRSNHSSKSRVKASSESRIDPRPAEAKRSTIAPGGEVPGVGPVAEPLDGVVVVGEGRVGVGQVVGEDHHAAGSDQFDLAAEERRGVGDVVQDVSRDRGVERASRRSGRRATGARTGPGRRTGRSGPWPGRSSRRRGRRRSPDARPRGRPG